MGVRRWHKWPLTAKLVAVFVLIAVLSTLAMAAISAAFLRDRMTADLQQRSLYRAAATARTLDACLSGLSDRLKEVASSPRTAAFVSQPVPGQRAEIESGLIRLTGDSGYRAVVITDRSGRAVAASDPNLLGASFASNPVFVWAIGGLTVIDDPVYEPVDGQEYIYFSAPVSVTGTMLGTVIGRITLNEIDAIVKADSNFTGSGEFGVLWNEHGIRLSQPSEASLRLRPLAQIPQNVADQLIAAERFGPKTRELVQPASPWPGVMEKSQALLRNRSFDPHLQVPVPDSDALQVSIAPLEKKRWFYGVAAPETRVNAAIARLWRLALIVILGAAVIAAAAAALITRGISRAAAGTATAPSAESASLSQPAPPSQITPAPQQEPASAETAAIAEALETRPVSGAPVPEPTPAKPAEHPDTPEPAPPEPPAKPAEQPPETPPAAGSEAAGVPPPPANLLSTPDQPRTRAIAPAPAKAELAGPPEPSLLQAPAVDVVEPDQEPPQDQAPPEQPAPPPQEAPPVVPPPAKEEPPASPQETGKPETPRKHGWGIPLARPPLGPLN